MVKIPILSLILGMIVPLKHEDTKQIFTLSSTDIPVESIPAKRCREIVESLEEQLPPQSAYMQITTHEHLYQFNKGVHVNNEHQPITLFSRGLHGIQEVNTTFLNKAANLGKAFIAVYKYMQVGAIQTAGVGFDYMDTWNTFDHGCQQRVDTLNSVLNEAQEKSDAIILFGDSAGAKAILNNAQKINPQYVKAIVLECPVLDLKTTTENYAAKNLAWLPYGNKIQYHFLKTIARGYNPHHDLTLQKMQLLPKQIPLFVGHSYNDNLIDNQSILTVVNSLRSTGHTVYFFVVDHPTIHHAHLAVTKPFIKAVNAFYKKYGLPYNEKLAQEGQGLLEAALTNGESGVIDTIKEI